MFDKLRAVHCFSSPSLIEIPIMRFAGWLIINRWLAVPEAPALHVLWYDGVDADSIKRAPKAREDVVKEERAGRNVLVRGAEALSAEPWQEERWKAAESVADALAHTKQVSSRSSRCAVMTTYVDDCGLDKTKPLRTSSGKTCEHNFPRKTQCKCRSSSVSCAKLDRYLLVPWSAFHSLRLHTEDLGRRCETWFRSDPCLHHCWTFWHAAGTTV